jgi:hypothetical protein
MRLEFFVDVEHAVANAVHGVTDLNVVVVPAKFLVRLWAGQELGAAEEVADTGN